MRITAPGHRPGIAFLIAAACALAPAPAGADAIGDFYAGRNVKLIISTGVGGGHDQTSRIIARHWTNHIPGKPNFVPQNMPGGGSLLATNFLYNVAPQDGSVVGSVIPSIVMHQVLGRKGVNYEAARFHWIGSSSRSNSMVFVWHATGVKTLKEAMAKPVIMGATGVASNSVRYPSVLNNVVGTGFRIIMGYRRTTDIDLAMERGEVQGRAGATFNTMLATREDWIREGKILLLAQIGPAKETGFENVPLITEFARDKAGREVLQVFCDDIALGRPYMVGPGVPADRVAALRASFDATMKDPALLADARKSSLDIAPTGGAELQKLVAAMVGMEPDLRARLKAALESKASIAGKIERKDKKKKKAN
jgi:tripartite-type tricarboxylate transporter receptor subunit TctC